MLAKPESTLDASTAATPSSEDVIGADAAALARLRELELEGPRGAGVRAADDDDDDDEENDDDDDDDDDERNGRRADIRRFGSVRIS